MCSRRRARAMVAAPRSPETMNMTRATVPASLPPLPQFCGETALAIWRDDAGAWRIGVKLDRRSPLLHLVVASALGRDWSAASVSAWSLLLRADFGGGDALEALQDATGCELLDAQDLTPLFARLALEQPEAIARLFPAAPAIAPAVLTLCGEHGLRAALHALRLDRRHHRLAGAIALLDRVGAGLAVPAAPVRAALCTEADRDVVDALRELLAVLEEQP